jgi:glycerol-3-phosphate cytidylyltransferase
MKVGITFSTFDLFHAGHVMMLEEAKRHYDYLITRQKKDIE